MAAAMNKYRGLGQKPVKVGSSPITSESRESYSRTTSLEKAVQADPRFNDSLCHTLGSPFNSTSSLKEGFRWHGQKTPSAPFRTYDNLGVLPGRSASLWVSSSHADFRWDGPKRRQGRWEREPWLASVCKSFRNFGRLWSSSHFREFETIGAVGLSWWSIRNTLWGVDFPAIFPSATKSRNRQPFSVREAATDLDLVL